MDLSPECDSTNPDQPLFSPSKTSVPTPITNFYSGKSVFVTGGTGFLGTTLIGKLLTCCPVKRVYMLIKTKHGKSVQERYAEYKESKIFDEFKENDASVLEKLVPISGDICEEQLGMCDEDITTLYSEVQVVFHVAANVLLDAKLKDALENNTKATDNLVTFCQGMRQLSIFLYASSAYSNSQRSVVEEKVYEPSTSIEAMYDIFNEDLKGKDDMLSTQYDLLMEKRPNNYTFSKSLAEKIVAEGFPGISSVIIIRPSIIMSSLKYPEPGWTSSHSAPNRMMLGIVAGHMRCAYADPNSLVDLVPVDQVANLFIASVWDADKQRTGKVKVFNCCSALRNPITVKKYLDSGHITLKKHGMAGFNRFLYIAKTPIIFKIMWFFLQIVPAYIVDNLLRLMLRKPRAAKINASIARAVAVSRYFLFNQITFIDFNTRQLWRDMHPHDRSMFDFDFTVIDWDQYMETYVLGIITNFLKRK